MIKIRKAESNFPGAIEFEKQDKTILSIDGVGEIETESSVEKITIKNLITGKGSVRIFAKTEKLNCTVKIFERSDRYEFKYNIKYNGENSFKCKLKIIFNFLDSGNPKWLVPGIFYADNMYGKSVRKYPKFNPVETDPNNLVSNYWSFSSKRASMPAVFCWLKNFMVAVLTDVDFSHGVTGLFFSSDLNNTELGLIFPFSEEPVSYTPYLDNKPIENFLNLHPNEEIIFSFKLFFSNSDPHAYDEIVRDFYYEMREKNKPSPWFSLEYGADLSAYGLYRWHFIPEQSVIYETRGFDNVLSLNVKHADTRAHMHISWVSGIPYAFALLKYGYLRKNLDYINAGRSVIEKVVTEGTSPAGILWSQWTAENGWTDGWNPKPGLTQARTLSEAILFLIRAYDFELKSGNEHLNWNNCILRNLNYAVKIQRDDGNFGSYYNSATGEIEIWEGCAGLMWISALCEAYKVFKDEKFKKSAIKAGEFYSRYILDELIYGAPEDAFMTPTSEDTYNAVISYVLLYEITGEEKWLKLAERSADLMMTFRFSYNLTFPKDTLLNLYNFKTIGADIASPVNQHLHNYGLICLPEMLKLYKFTSDEYYLDRTIDNICFSLQFIARFDGDFNAFRGMMTEQFYYVDWLRPAGTILTLSHSWCLGMVIYAYLSVIESEYKDLIFNRIKKYMEG
jgi:hypothetical protein